jgi:hypothetical protein
VKTRSEERLPDSACDDKFDQEIKKSLGSAPLLYDENQKDYNQISRLVIEQLRPANILEEIWVKDYTYWYLEAQRLSRLKQNLFYTAVEDSVARVISPFLHHNMLKVRLLARDWASRTPTALAEVDELLGNAGLDREAIYAQNNGETQLSMISNGGERVWRRDCTGMARSYLNFLAGRKLIRTARADSNRRNARRSTGPKSAAGKAKVANNALRHGLAIPARLDPALNREIEGFAELIAGASASAFLLDCARRIAEAQIDLRRIRRVRLLAWSKVETDELKRDDPLRELSQVSLGFDSFWPERGVECLRKAAPSA